MNKFVWGVASSAYQIEGAWNEDGKGASVWDDFCHAGGNISGGHTGDIACDHYHRYREDVALMRELGIRAYRFSVSWARLFPEGTGEKNPKGFEFYDRLIDELLENDIEPWLTLFHWDLPSALMRTGGFENYSVSEAFAEYAAAVVSAYSDRVKRFITLNEPQIVVLLGYGTGEHAPGLKLNEARRLNVMRNQILCHTRAVPAMRASAARDIEIGIASTGRLCYPQTPADVEIARRMSFENTPDNWEFSHSTLLDAVISDPTSPPIDFLGVNVYNGTQVNRNGVVPHVPGRARTAINWSVTPEVMRWGLEFLYERYRLPIYVTENGASCNDKQYLDGAYHDADRIDFLMRYITEMRKAVADVRGYFHWSFTDNFEWHNGYDDRFGLVYVDYQTQKRSLKDSAYWYSRMIEGGI